MDLMVFGAVGVIVLAVVLWPGKALAKERRREMSQLRWPTLNRHAEQDFSEEVFADLSEMVLGVARHYLEKPAWRRTTLYELRRNDGPTWEMKEQVDSWRRSLAIARREQLSDPARWSARADELARGSAWQPVPGVWAPSLEAAYQRFTLRFLALSAGGRSRIEEELLKDFDERVVEPPAATQ